MGRLWLIHLGAQSPQKGSFEAKNRSHESLFSGLVKGSLMKEDILSRTRALSFFLWPTMADLVWWGKQGSRGMGTKPGEWELLLPQVEAS